MVRKMPAFKTNIVAGSVLLALSKNVRGWQKRDCRRQLNAYLHNAECGRVRLLFGLRRTGKTTLLRQAVLDMTPEDAAKTAYVKATKQDTIADPNRDMEQLRSLGFRYVLLDEVTLMRDFIGYRNAEEFLKGLPATQFQMDRTPSDHSGPRRT